MINIHNGGKILNDRFSAGQKETRRMSYFNWREFGWHWCLIGSKPKKSLHLWTLPMHNLKVIAWCAESTCKIIGPMSFEETINSGCYIWLILTPFFRELTEEKMYGYFMQDNATAHTADFSMTVLEQVYGEWLIYHLLWPPRSPDMNLQFLFVGDTTGQSLCKQSTFFARTERQYLKRNN
jgi:hypothetical protein